MTLEKELVGKEAIINTKSGTNTSISGKIIEVGANFVKVETSGLGFYKFATILVVNIKTIQTKE